MSLGLSLWLLCQGFLLLQLDAAWTHKLLTLQVCNHSLLSLESHMKPISLGIDQWPLPSRLNCLKALALFFLGLQLQILEGELNFKGQPARCLPSLPPPVRDRLPLFCLSSGYDFRYSYFCVPGCPQCGAQMPGRETLTGVICFRDLTTLLVICDVLMWIWVCVCTCTCVEVCVSSINSSRSVLSKTAASSHS